MARSLIGNLIRYVPTPQRTQTENLLTEWLAEILRDCFDFRAAVFGNIISELKNEGGVSIRTQFPITDAASEGNPICGWIDIALTTASTLMAIEVKWDADESGDQLHRYREYLRCAGPRFRTTSLVFLAKSLPEEGVLSTGPDVVLTWRDIARAARRILQTPTSSTPTRGHLLLRDLRTFLEEAMPESDLSLAIVSAATETPRLVQFVHGVLQQTCEQIAKSWPRFSGMWTSKMDGWFFKTMLKWNCLATYEEIGAFRVYIGIQLRPNLPVDEIFAQPIRYVERFPWAGVWVDLNPKKIDLWNAVAEPTRSFLSSRVNQEWYSNERPEGWMFLYRLRPLVSFQTHEDPAAALQAWFVESIKALDGGGMVKTLESLGSK